MAKKTLTMPQSGTTPPPSPLKAMTHPAEPVVETKKVSSEQENKRTTIVINPDTYRKFKAYAAESGQTVTSLINEFMEQTLAAAGK